MVILYFLLFVRRGFASKGHFNRLFLVFSDAYLHNYPRIENDPLDKEQYQDIMEETPAFTYGQREALRTFIKKQIVTGDKEDTLLKIEHGKIKPSKQLQDALVNMLKGNQEFVMLDEQKVVYESILEYSCQCQKDGKKRTIIVEGGPGTGKTVIAINLLTELTNQMQFVQYVSKNAAPDVYKRQIIACMMEQQIRRKQKVSLNRCWIEL